MIPQGQNDQDLRAAWDAAAAGGELLHDFVASDDEPSGAWRGGDRVRFGVGRDPRGARLRFQAVNLSTGRPISPDIRERPVGTRGFRCLCHPFRRLRPGADAGPGPGGCGFGCEDADAPLSLLRRSTLLRVALPNAVWNAYPNAAPFHRLGHCLWVPAGPDPGADALPHRPQKLTADILEDVAALALDPASRGIVLLYNGLGGGASVDHIHVHAMVHDPRLAIADADVVEYGGETILADHPAAGMVFDLRQSRVRARLTSWSLRLQEEGIPLNLVLCEGRAFLFARSVNPSPPTDPAFGRIAAIELAGTLIVGNPSFHENLSEPALFNAMGAATIPPAEFMDRIGPMDSQASHGPCPGERNGDGGAQRGRAQRGRS